jgi:RimJ/RimL family protein N-acetyltransferase
MRWLRSTTLVLDWAVYVALLRCVYLAVLANNTAAIRADEKASDCGSVGMAWN